jgi:hypothetical protein
LTRALAALVAAQLLASLMAPAAEATYQASVYTNITAFAISCSGINDTYPSKIYTLAMDGFAYLGYTRAGYSGPGFTSSKFLSRVPADKAVFVHSHGDVYSGHQGFRVDAGYCTGAPVVNDTNVDAARGSTPIQIAIMSMCHLGEAPPSGTVGMSAAFGIPYNNKTLAAYAFYLAYKWSAYDSDEYKFEQLLWSRVKSGGATPIYALADAYAWAKPQVTFKKATGETYTPTVVWFGSPVYTGWADTSSGCSLCK